MSIVTRADPQDSSVGPLGVRALPIWLFFQIAAGHITLPILVAIFTFSTKAKRHPTLINLCVTWIISGICSCLLFYDGTHIGLQPGTTLCLTQAALLYGVPPMTALSTFGLVFQVFTGVSGTTSDRFATKDPHLRTAILLILPYIPFAGFATASAWVGLRDLTFLTRDRRVFYCSVQNSLLTNSISICVAVTLVATIILEVWIGIILHRNWRALRKAGNGSGFDVSLVLRVIVFGGYVFIGLILSLLSIVAPKTIVPDMWIASVGLAVVLIFGSQGDVIRVFMFWKKDQERTLIGSRAEKDKDFEAA